MRPIAFVAWHVCRSGRERVNFVDEIYVTPEHRKKGIGTFLLKRLARRRRVELHARRDSLQFSFYKHIGGVTTLHCTPIYQPLSRDAVVHLPLHTDAKKTQKFPHVRYASWAAVPLETRVKMLECMIHRMKIETAIHILKGASRRQRYDVVLAS